MVRTRAGSTSPQSPTSSSSAVRAPPNSWLPFAGAQGPGLTQTRVAGATFLTFHFMISDLVTFRRAARPGPPSPPSLRPVAELPIMPSVSNHFCIKIQTATRPPPVPTIPNILSLVGLPPPPLPHPSAQGRVAGAAGRAEAVGGGAYTAR